MLLLNRNDKMATGDVKNNLRKLVAELKRLNYPISDLNLKALGLGAPTAFLPILHYIFLDFSVDLTEYFAKDYELYGKTDLRFVETVYKIMRDIFQYKPQLTREQFLAIGFAERKIIQVCEILKHCREKCLKLNPKGSKMEKKQPGKLKAKSIECEKKENDKIRMKSCLKSSDYQNKANNFQKRNVVEMSNRKINSGKSIPKTSKDDDKENTNNSQSALTGQKQNGQLEKPSRFKSGVKNVKWDDNEQSTIPNAALCSFDPVSNLAYASASSLRQVTTTVTLPHPPKLIPAPVSMTTAPEPSPDLMLTPITKSKHQAIPLSNSRHDATNVQNADISLVDLTDSTPITQPKIVRHSAVGNDQLPQYNLVHERPLPSHRTNDHHHHLQQSTVGNHPHISNNVPSTAQDREVQSLKALITEMQDKLDSVLATNNEMSARIVLLENKVKLLEEGLKEDPCRSCSRKEYLPNSLETARSFTVETNRPLSMETTRPVTMEATRPTIFRSTDRGESLSVSMATTRPLATTSVADYVSQRSAQSLTNTIPSQSHENKSPSLTTKRYLFDEFNESRSATTSNDHMRQRQPRDSSGYEESSTPEVIEISDNDVTLGVSNSKVSAIHSPERMRGIQEFEVISPLASKDIHIQFSDPTTTATILNVERRLKETREMLANATSKGISIP